jgi:hypothetical protein
MQFTSYSLVSGAIWLLLIFITILQKKKVLKPQSVFVRLLLGDSQTAPSNISAYFLHFVVWQTIRNSLLLYLGIFVLLR